MLMLHICCAPCAAPVIDQLLAREIRPTLFFFNPNIYPQAEYEIRKNEIMYYADSLNLHFISGNYHHSLWLERINGMESQPERGIRCLECFKMRLSETAYLAKQQGFSYIATTLAFSRWKSFKQISEAGNIATSGYSGIKFLNENWRKNRLRKCRNYLQKNFFYNQFYCGCEFSLNQKRFKC